MPNIWFTSDTHYHHKNMVSGTSDWEDRSKCRKFETIETHDDQLVQAINTVVKPEDTLYHLGDWSFGGIERVWEFRKRLNCMNIHLILGNHDHHIEKNRKLVTWPQEAEMLELLKVEYQKTPKMIEFNLQDLFSSVQHYREVTIEGKHIILCHYAMRVWNKSHKGSWMLYGHSHGTLEQMRPQIANPTWLGDMYYTKNYRTMDVGADTNYLMPYSFGQLKEIMADKDVLLEVDHHDNQTT